MLSSKKIFFLTVCGLSFLLFSCGGKKDDTSETNIIDFENPEVVLQQAQKVLGANVKLAYKGKFDSDSVIEIAAGLEVQDAKDWGIKFALLKMSDNKLNPVFETSLLNGSFKECHVQKINLPSLNYELIYYNSQDYFLGSGGGEVYSYIINYNENKTYYAHLIAEPGRPTSLYLSDNIDVPEVKSFFLTNFKRDYPGFKMVSKDIVLKY